MNDKFAKRVGVAVVAWMAFCAALSLAMLSLLVWAVVTLVHALP